MAWDDPDARPPEVWVAYTYSSSDGRWTLLADEGLDTNSVPAKEAFSLQIGGVNQGLSGVGVGLVSGLGTIVLTLSPIPTDAQMGQIWRLVYTPPSENPLQDLAGNHMPSTTPFAGAMAASVAVRLRPSPNPSLNRRHPTAPWLPRTGRARRADSRSGRRGTTRRG